MVRSQQKKRKKAPTQQKQQMVATKPKKDIKGFRKFKDCHKGEEIIIVANGPSLGKVSVDFLKSRLSFGCNRIGLMGTRQNFWPTFYLDLGSDHFDTPEKRATMIPSVLHSEASFLNRYWAHYFPYENVYSILGAQLPDKHMRLIFSDSPLEWIGVGYTSLFPMLQIAFHMGFSRALIVGLDHEYPTTSKKHFYDDAATPGFELGGASYHPSHLRACSDLVFKIADWEWSHAGRRIVDLTEGGKCTVFEKGQVQDWVK